MCELSMNSVLLYMMSLPLIKVHEEVAIDGEDRVVDMLQEYDRVF